MTTYLKNTWYVAAWSQEIVAGQLLARTLLDEPIVLWRDAEGAVRALHDRCPHRFAPLSMGRVQPDAQSVQCPYHGLEFGKDGQCVRNPHGDGGIPRAAKVKTFPVEERWGVVWIWMGDAALAQAALIPDYACLDSAANHVATGYLTVAANYLLEVDNIMDLSHIQFLHANTLGGQAAQGPSEVRQDGNSVWSLRGTHDEELPEFLYQAFDIPMGMRVDRWLDVRWDAPSNLLLVSGSTPTGQPRTAGRGAPFAHFFTPATWKSTHYFFAVSMDKTAWPDGATRAPMIIEGVRVPFLTEDSPMVEAQQRLIGDADFWSLNPVLLSSDAPGVRARRVLQGLIKQEQSAEEAPR